MPETITIAGREFDQSAQCGTCSGLLGDTSWRGFKGDKVGKLTHYFCGPVDDEHEWNPPAVEAQSLGPDDTFNRYLVGGTPGAVIIGNSQVLRPLSRLEAMNLAAWVVVLAESLPGDVTFEQMLAAVLE